VAIAIFKTEIYAARCLLFFFIGMGMSVDLLLIILLPIMLIMVLAYFTRILGV